MSLSPEWLAALRRAAATRPEIEQLVWVERRVEPRSEEPFVDRTLVVVLEDPPTSPPGPEFARDLVLLFLRALGGLENLAVSTPSRLGMGPATAGGEVVYVRGVA